MSEELKPCPFCGSEARLDQRVTQSLWNSSDAVFSHVACDECDISGQDFCDDPDGEEAIEWWNRRAQPAEVEGVEVIGYICGSPDEPEIGHWLDEVASEAFQCQALIRQSDHIAALSAVTAELDRLQKDAKRYRWLREQEAEEGIAVLPVGRWEKPAMLCTTPFDSPEMVDAVVDAAMTAKEE